jgi:hypothetical protein
MKIIDYHSSAAFLVFNLTFPFMKHDLSQDELNPITSNELDTYRCAEITINTLKREFSNQGVKCPDYYDEAHQYIVDKILELKENLKNK